MRAPWRIAVPVLAALAVALPLALGACVPKAPPAVVAMEPRPNPPMARFPDNPRERLRRNRWLAQFWEELTPAQRRRVETRMRRVQPPVAGGREAAAQAWDGLGLAERDRLVFGGAAPSPRHAATAAKAVEAEDETPPRAP